jgi:Ca2+-transporting ATPase
METFADRRFLIATAASIGFIVFGTELRIFNRILDTVSLTGSQWVVCILSAASIIVASEIWKFVMRRRPEPRPELAAATSSPAPATP